MIMLDPIEQKWAQRLAEVQGEREELIRLLGLINQISGITVRSGSLQAAARDICTNLANHLILDYCAFYVSYKDKFLLAGKNSQEIPDELADLIIEKIQEEPPYSQRLENGYGGRLLICLPISGQGQRMGVLAIMPARELGQRDLRHLRLAGDAIVPVLETFLLRNQLQESNRELNQAAMLTRRGLEKFRRLNLHSQDFLEKLLQHSPHPVFLADSQGRLIRHNPALELLLGRDGANLAGQSLAPFFSRTDDWRLVQDAASQCREILGRKVKLSVHFGHELMARLSLIPIDQDGAPATAMGVLQKEEVSPRADGGMMPLDELNELAASCRQAMGSVNDMLASMRANLQMILMADLDRELRPRLELLESITHDQGGAMTNLERCLERIEDRGRKANGKWRCWDN